MSAKRTAKAPDSVADHGFVRVSAAVPVVALADPAVNAARTVELLRAAADDGAAVIAFPELGLTGYSVDDLVQQDALLDAALAALDTVRAATAGCAAIVCVGVPLRVGDGLYNTAAVLHDGEILGVVATNIEQEYDRYLKLGDIVKFEAIIDDVSDESGLVSESAISSRSAMNSPIRIMSLLERCSSAS